MIHLSCGWVACFHRSAPLWLLPAPGAMVITRHGSFQHEAVYDQFSSKRWLYNLVAYLPLTLGVPFRIYRRTHRARHNFNILTDPRRGSESLRMDQASWSPVAIFSVSTADLFAMAGLAWIYRHHRQKLLQENGGPYNDGGYKKVARRFLIWPVDHPQHAFI